MVRIRFQPLPVLAVTAGVALLALAAPRMNAAFIQVAADPVIRSLERGGAPDPDALERLVANRREALAVVADSAGWFDIGRARVAGAARAGPRTQKGRTLLDQAATAYENGLALSPGNSIEWMRLAEVRLQRSGPSRKAADALYMSLRSAPFILLFTIERLRLGLRLWDHMGAPGREAVLDQVRISRRNQWLAPRFEKLASDPKYRAALAPLIEKAAVRLPSGSVSIKLAPYTNLQ